MANEKLLRLLNLKANAPLELFKVLEKFEILVKETAQKIAQQEIEKIKEKLENGKDEILKEIKESKEEFKKEIEINKFVEMIKGAKGDDGGTPTTEDLIKIIKPLIPEPLKGDMPSEQDLIKLIKPLIPKPIKGDKGDSPIKGIDYFDGENGKIPIKGIDYFDGENGSPDKPKEIAEKLNTLEEEIKISVIKGLQKELIKLRQNIIGKKGGGGMGKVIHEQFSGDGLTTVFTLSDSVAGNGTAVIGCRYEGQMQYLGDQFTITGTNYKILTITFIPANDTKIEITYIRG